MNGVTLKKSLIEKIDTLSEEQINSVMAFVEALQNPLENSQQADKQRKALAEEFKQLCSETQSLFADNSITEEQIQAEIDAYRRGE
ncbi:MAG: hypothetical protein VKL42_14045 [Snowella sp.]|nr:hypothetical protein [Snowella sp.]